MALKYLKWLCVFVIVALETSIGLASSQFTSPREYTITVQIIIKRPIREVYEFIANAENDIYWRSEVHSVTSTSGVRLGSIFLEDAALGIHPHYQTYTQIILIKENHLVLYETPDFQPYYLSSLREVKFKTKNSTIVSYQVQFRKDFIHELLGFPWPGELAVYGYKTQMKKYIKNLKFYLEDRQNHDHSKKE